MKKIFAAALVVSLCASCGTMPSDRSISGAGLGAAAGAVVGAVTGMGVFPAAALGAAGGAVTGAVTSSDQIDFGKPAWKNGVAGDPSPSSPVVVEIQKGLARLGYEPGPIDGIVGSQTRNAIRQFERDHRLLVDGRASPQLARYIRRQEESS